MFDLPPQVTELSHVQEQVYIVQAANKGASTFSLKPHRGIELVHDIEMYAKSVKGLLGDGFQWADIPKAVTYTGELLTDIFGDSKRGLMIGIIDKVIDITDTPVLPDSITDPIFKVLAHSLINLTFDLIEGKPIFHRPTLWEDQSSAAAPSKEVLGHFTYQLKDIFEDGFQWGDIAKMIALSADFMDQFVLVGEERKKAYIIQILDDVIDITNTPFLPDSVFDPIFKILVPTFVDFIMELKK